MNDPFIDEDICVTRLVAEWTEHPRLIVALDFDDTVFDFHEHGDTHDGVLGVIRECKALGFYVVVFTASAPNRWEMIERYLLERGIKIDGINRNPVDMPHGHYGKMYYNILLDDRAGLGQALNILTHTIAIVKESK